MYKEGCMITVMIENINDIKTAWREYDTDFSTRVVYNNIKNFSDVKNFIRKCHPNHRVWYMKLDSTE